jgi:hypothetical protein
MSVTTIAWVVGVIVVLVWLVFKNHTIARSYELSAAIARFAQNSKAFQEHLGTPIRQGKTADRHSDPAEEHNPETDPDGITLHLIGPKARAFVHAGVMPLGNRSWSLTELKAKIFLKRPFPLASFSYASVDLLPEVKPSSRTFHIDPFAERVESEVSLLVFEAQPVALQPSGERVTATRKHNFVGVLAGGCAVVALFFAFSIGAIFFFATRPSATTKMAVEVAQRDARVQKILGTPISEGRVTGSSFSYAGGAGKATSTVKISGPKRSGVLIVDSESKGTQLKLVKLIFKADGSGAEIDLLKPQEPPGKDF